MHEIFAPVEKTAARGGATRKLVGLITRRLQVQILPPLFLDGYSLYFKSLSIPPSVYSTAAYAPMETVGIPFSTDHNVPRKDICKTGAVPFTGLLRNCACFAFSIIFVFMPFIVLYFATLLYRICLNPLFLNEPDIQYLPYHRHCFPEMSFDLRRF